VEFVREITALRETQEVLIKQTQKYAAEIMVLNAQHAMEEAAICQLRTEVQLHSAKAAMWKNKYHAYKKKHEANESLSEAKARAEAKAEMAAQAKINRQAGIDRRQAAAKEAKEQARKYLHEQKEIALKEAKAASDISRLGSTEAAVAAATATVLPTVADSRLAKAKEDSDVAVLARSLLLRPGSNKRKATETFVAAVAAASGGGGGGAIDDGNDRKGIRPIQISTISSSFDVKHPPPIPLSVAAATAATTPAAAFIPASVFTPVATSVVTPAVNDALVASATDFDNYSSILTPYQSSAYGNAEMPTSTSTLNLATTAEVAASFSDDALSFVGSAIFFHTNK